MGGVWGGWEVSEEDVRCVWRGRTGVEGEKEKALKQTNLLTAMMRASRLLVT